MRQSKLGLGGIALIVALVAILVASLWFAVGAWLNIAGPPMPRAGYIFMILGVAFSLLVGCGLMVLVFYSSRHGYDEPWRPDEKQE